MKITDLISECSAYDFKLMLDEKKPKSWLKSVSALANGLGGSLFLGIDNSGVVKGLDDIQSVCETISSKIRDYMDPLPDVEMIPHKTDEGMYVLQLKVNSGNYTPYYYVGDGQRVAFVRVGDESVPATAEHMVRLVLKGSNKTYDSIITDYRQEDYSFVILANEFKKRTEQDWDKKYLLSFGLVTGNGFLTNAGALFSDDCPLWQSRLYCTRWDGKDKSDAINDAEFTGNIIMLLRESMNFVKSNTRKGWEKLPNGRKNKPDYMEKRGSGFKRICNETEKLESYKADRKPVFRSTSSQFMTIIFSMGYNEQDARDSYQVGTKQGLSWEQVGAKLELSWGEVEKLIIALQHPTSISDLKSLYGWSNASKFKAKYVTPLINEQLVCMTHPDKPTSPNQRYCLTDKGKILLASEVKTTDAEDNVNQLLEKLSEEERHIALNLLQKGGNKSKC